MTSHGNWFGAALVCLLIASNAAQAQDAPSTVQTAPYETAIAHARTVIGETMETDHIPAMAVAIYHGDRLIWNQAFGTADIENDVAATPEHLFRIGSLAKLFTATLAARMAQQGLVDLDRPIRDYLPEWPERHAPITLRQLLGHLGGVRHYIERDHDPDQMGGDIDVRRYTDRASILAIFADDDLRSAPGEAYLYTTFGFELIGLVLEAASGSDYYSLLQTHVLEPGDIENVVVDNRYALIPNRADVYDPIGDYEGYLPSSMGPVVNAGPLNSFYKLAAGGLVADAANVALYGTLHFAPGLLTEDMYAQMFTSQRTNDGEETGTGLGWWIANDAEGRTFYSHTGSQQGSRAYLAVYPEQQISVAIVSNMGHRPDDIASVSARLMEPFLD